jgi:NAD(P)-dependent dehydrogenase (short-subunit alcohol dehydrogenase family)
LRRKPSIPRFGFSLFERPGTCPFDALAARTGRRAAGSTTRKSSLPHYGGNQQIDFRELSAAAFEALWRVGCFGGFLVGREAARRLAPLGHGTIIFTGASASLGGKPGFAHFAAAKAGLRMITQSIARKYGPLGIYVAHVVIDGGIDGDRLRNRAPTLIKDVARTACSVSTRSPKPIGTSIASRVRPGRRKSTCGRSRKRSEARKDSRCSVRIAWKHWPTGL